MWNYEKVKEYMLKMDKKPWEIGIAIDSLLAIKDIKNAENLVYDSVNEQNFAGELAGGDPTWVNSVSIGPGILYFYNRNQNLSLLEACKKQYNFLKRAPYSVQNAILHLKEKQEVWVDTLYMVPPFLAMMDDSEWALQQIKTHNDVLFDEKKGLYRHAWSDIMETYSGKGYWGVGNGWAMAGLIKVIELLPAGHSKRKELIEFLLSHIDSVLKYQNENGMWHYLLDDPTTWEETNGSQMFAYSILKAIANGWLDRSYLNKIEMTFETIKKQVRENGEVDNACAAPHFDHPGSAVESQAWNLMLYAEMKKQELI